MRREFTKTASRLWFACILAIAPLALPHVSHSRADDPPAGDGPMLVAPDGQQASKPVRVARRPVDTQGSSDKASTRSSGRDLAEPLPIDQLSPTATRDRHSLSPQMLVLREKVRSCLDTYYRRSINAATYTPWEAMHALLPWGVDANMRVNGREVNAIGWLCWNQPCRGQRLMYRSSDRIYAAVGVGLQGHEGQFLSMLAQSRVPADYGIKVAGKDFTVRDLVESEMRTCRSGTELTFKLIALSHYLPSDTKWKNDLGEDWDIPRLIREELRQPINGVACGGTHRMSGFAYAVRKRQQRGEPITGEWARAHKYVRDYHKYLYSLQNPNGSFSTNWFRSRGDSGDIDRYVQTTGHMLEFLVFSLPKDELEDPRLIKAMTFLSDLLMQYPNRRWEIGPLGHALHALAIYDERAFGTEPGHRTAAKRRAAKRR